MRLHPNAKTTPASRALLVRRVRVLGWSPEDAAEAAGVSVRTTYKWMRRYRLEGKQGLLDRGCSPHRIPRRTSRTKQRQIERLRRKGRMTAWEIAQAVRTPCSTVSAVLNRLGLGRLCSLVPKPKVQRYEKDHPGELIHLDTKKLGGIRRVGHRIHGDRSTRVRGAGWDFVHVAVDDRTRLSYCEVLKDERKETATAFLQRAVAWFESLGIEVQGILTDNGPCYLSTPFRRACDQLGIRHHRTRPYRPQTNGKAERFIQTLIRRWAYAKAYPTSQARTKALPRWIEEYNERRPHRSLRMLPPMAVLQRIAEQRS